MEGSLRDLYGVLEQLKYINHLGEEIDFGRDGMYVNENDLHNFSWSVQSTNNRISGFTRGIQTKNVPVRIACTSKVDGIVKRNRLFEVPERDVLAMEHGRLIVNGYYCECFVTASKKARYSISEQYMAVDLTITTDRPAWVKETEIEVKADSEWRPESDTGLDFSFDFPFDFNPSTDRISYLTNESFYDTNFRLDIHGAVLNPTVFINEHEYQVNTNVMNGQVLTIDSVAKTIYLDDENVFDARLRDSYIFQPISSGELSIRWDNTFDFDLYLLEERSEPRWVLS